jgi:hypothetical protein
MAFNITHKDPVLPIYGDPFPPGDVSGVNREELNEVLWFGLGKAAQATLLGVPFVSGAIVPWLRSSRLVRCSTKWA